MKIEGQNYAGSAAMTFEDAGRIYDDAGLWAA
jgi:hypothetical protein